MSSNTGKQEVMDEEKEKEEEKEKREEEEEKKGEEQQKTEEKMKNKVAKDVGELKEEKSLAMSCFLLNAGIAIQSTTMTR